MFDEVFRLVLGIVSEKGLLKGRIRGVDSTYLQADASMKSIVRKDSGEEYAAYIRRLANEDGVVFLPETITARTIRDGDVYPGVRAVLEARLATARVTFSVDVNVGDPVVPGPARTAVPALLGGERIDMFAYPKSMVVAEKLVTALQRGRASTRWRDFADLFVLVAGALPEAEAVEAVRVVASHRGVSLQPLDEVLAGMPNEAQRLWATWRARHGAEARVPEDFAAVLDALDVATLDWIVAAAGV